MGYAPPTNKNLPPVQPRQPAVQPQQQQEDQDQMPHRGWWESFTSGVNSPLLQGWNTWMGMTLNARQWLNQNPGKTYDDYLAFRRKHTRKRLFGNTNSWFHRALLNIEMNKQSNSD